MNYGVYKKIIPILVILIIIFLLLHIFVFLKISRNSNDISILENSLRSSEDKQDYMSQIADLINENREDIDLIQNAILSKGGDVEFIETVESLAEEKGLSVNIQSLNLEESQDLEGHDMTFLKIRLQTRGTWVGTYSFLAELEALPFAVRIDNVALVNSSSESVNGTRVEWQSMFDMKVLKYK